MALFGMVLKDHLDPSVGQGFHPLDPSCHHPHPHCPWTPPEREHP